MAGTFRAHIEHTQEGGVMVWIPTRDGPTPSTQLLVDFVRFPTEDDLQRTGGTLEGHVLLRETNGREVWWLIKK